MIHLEAADLSGGQIAPSSILLKYFLHPVPLQYAQNLIAWGHMKKNGQTVLNDTPIDVVNGDVIHLFADGAEIVLIP